MIAKLSENVGSCYWYLQVMYLKCKNKKIENKIIEKAYLKILIKHVVDVAILKSDQTSKGKNIIRFKENHHIMIKNI